jgi:hypothetical protein
MSDILIRASLPRDGRWTYDDPSGVPDAPLAFRVPDTLRGGIEHAAAGEGLTPAAWLAALVTRTLVPATPKAV